MGSLAKAENVLHGKLENASPHTIWVRRDIWEAVKLYKLRNKISIRSIIEQALVAFLEDSHEEKPKEMTEPEKWGNE